MRRLRYRYANGTYKTSARKSKSGKGGFRGSDRRSKNKVKICIEVPDFYTTRLLLYKKQRKAKAEFSILLLYRLSYPPMVGGTGIEPVTHSSRIEVTAVNTTAFYHISKRRKTATDSW